MSSQSDSPNSQRGAAFFLSFDWEDWFQLCAPPFDGPGALDRYLSRLGPATDLALEFCDSIKARATWFCLADQAARNKGLVRQIADRGHAIGLHGHTHKRMFQLNQKTFMQETARAKAFMEDMLGGPIIGFRAPEWSLRRGAEHYWEGLAGMGFRYDSSRAPILGLGSVKWGRRPYLLENGLWEMPPLAFGPMPMWGWPFRTAPEPILRRALKWAAMSPGGVLVLHPWELDYPQPRLRGAPLAHRFVHCAGLKGYGQRLLRLFGGFGLCPLESFFGETI